MHRIYIYILLVCCAARHRCAFLRSSCRFQFHIYIKKCNATYHMHISCIHEFISSTNFSLTVHSNQFQLRSNFQINPTELIQVIHYYIELKHKAKRIFATEYAIHLQEENKNKLVHRIDSKLLIIDISLFVVFLLSNSFTIAHYCTRPQSQMGLILLL